MVMVIVKVMVMIDGDSDDAKEEGDADCYRCFYYDEEYDDES